MPTLWEALNMSREEYENKKSQVASLFQQAISHTTTFLWFTKSLTGPPKTMRGASIFFVDLGDGPIAVTADHVYTRYAEQKQTTPNLVCHVGGRVLYLEERLIDCDRELDIATFRASPEEVNTDDLEKTLYRAAPVPWAPTPPRPGEALVICGFRGGERDLLSHDDLVVGVDSMLFQATSVNSRQIVCQWEYGKFMDPWGTGVITPDTDLGGLSGGSVWKQSAIDPNRLELAGVVSECSPNLGLLHATRVDCIDSSGRLKRPLVV